MILFIILIALTILFFIWGSYKKEPQKNGFNQALLPIKSDFGSGQAVIWKLEGQKAVILTASHIIGETTPKEIQVFEEACLVENAYISSSYDLAFLEIELPEKMIGSQVEEELSYYDLLDTESSILICGYLDGKYVEQDATVKSSWIYMEDFGYHMLWCKAPNTYGGMSGSGIFDLEAHFLGILSGGTADGEIAVIPLVLIETEAKKADWIW